MGREGGSENTAIRDVTGATGNANMDCRLGHIIDSVLSFLSVIIVCDYVGECHYS